MQATKKNIVFTPIEKLLSKLMVVLAFLYTPSINAQELFAEFKKEIQMMENQENFNPNDTLYISRLVDLGYDMRYHNMDSLLFLSKKILKLSKPIDFKYGEGYGHVLHGLYDSDQGNSKKAIKNFTKGLKLLKQTNDYASHVDILNLIALEHLYCFEPAEALPFYMESIDICKKNEMTGMLSTTFLNIGQLYCYSLRNHSQALYFLNESKKIESEIEDPYYYNIVLSNLAHVYLDKGDLDKAIDYIEPSIAFSEKDGELEFILYNYTIKVGILIKDKKFQEASIWLDKLKKVHEQMQDDKSLCTFYNFKSTVSLNLNNFTAAEEYAEKSYALSKEIHFVDGTKNALKNLYELYKEKDDFDKALKYHERFQKLTDSILKVEDKKNLSALLTKIEFDEKKRKLIQKNELARAQQNRYIVLAIIVLCIICCIVFIQWKNTKLYEKLNVQLQFEKEKLEHNELVLKEANRTKDKLFSIIGHDLRSPIGAFQGLLTLFNQNEIDEDEFVSFIPKLESDLDSISFMLNNLLSWGRSQMNGDTTTPEVMEVESLFKENINLLSEVAHNKAIAVVNKVTSEALIWADVNQIDIVFRNLLSNALKFTRDHGVITVGMHEKEDTWQFYVKDTGVGMDKETQEKIFAKSETHSTYGTNNEKGTGLGLNLCKEMVQKNNGTIWVESKVNIGSCFYFELPKAREVYKNVG